MASSPDNISMALFCDFENVALGVRDAKYDKFDIKRVLERLLLKGSIVVKKAYCDWERYKGFKAAMHEANFELIEIPHVRQSGKNSADIRLVVDALDLCYTKAHVNTFVIISGDSDFSPLVSKLRENAKQVIGVGVKQSTSDLLIANCDEFIFYDDLVREAPQAAAKREANETQPAARRSPEEEKRRKEELAARKSQAIEFAVETFEALLAERGDSGKIWASMLKEAIKRRKPGFNETYYGFRAFGNLLEEAQARGLLEFGRDEKSGAYVYRSNAGPTPAVHPAAEHPADGVKLAAMPAGATHAADEAAAPAPAAERPAGRRPRQGDARAAKKSAKQTEAAQLPTRPETETAREATQEVAQEPAKESPAQPGRRQKNARQSAQRAASAPATVEAAVAPAPAATVEAPPAEPAEARSGSRRRGSSQRKPAARQDAPVAAPVAVAAAAEAAPAPAAEEAVATPARKSAPRSRRPRKQETPPDAA
ncbi:NYN domain protein [Azoarcus sp. DD4]|uniref:NYN domain-containing protein n=1 Tax=Azoarcus sp. DD4 TaxID=2027405 RepID=UPI00112A5FA1|nr:NYN domain-containing protein [Azoarcus sp. DD4]QDF98132.1 NYN domain protein [Azoarcus sp. DD4]